jgi:hypothetical protein
MSAAMTPADLAAYAADNYTPNGGLARVTVEYLAEPCDCPEDRPAVDITLRIHPPIVDYERTPEPEIFSGLTVEEVVEKLRARRDLRRAS